MNDEAINVDEKRTNESDPFKKLINIAMVIMLVALIFIALFTFFFSMQSAIGALLAPQYVELTRAIFSLVVLGAGIYLVKMFLSKKW
ncbi:MAG: hypothetical protein FIB08_09815 [Candidatus Methanoperedens sp.]|nr:hypothetical protein [Candidatus Methanoperedens sp.]